MTFRDKAAISWSNLGRRKVRTFLTSVGVIVGIVTVVTMVSLVNGVQYQVNEQFKSIGLDRVAVRPLSSGGGNPFGGGGGFDPFGSNERIKIISDKDIARWKKWPEVKSVTPEVDVPRSIITGLRFKSGQKTVPVRIEDAVDPRPGPFAEEKKALHGSLELPDVKGSIVVSKGVMRNLGIKERGLKEQLGKEVEIVLAAPRGEKQTYAYRIVGISSQGSRGVYINTSDRLAIKSWWFNEPDPLKEDGYDSVSLRAANVSDAKLLVDKIKKENWDVISIDAILDVANRIFSVITVMLALASSIALMVASIGIVNTMIMSIYERTREIGTLKAMGASKTDIRHLFMIEAGLIGLIGGASGLILSWMLGKGLNRIAIIYAERRGMPIPEHLFIITPVLALEAMAFALFIGVAAGLYPANRAAGLDPLKALRNE